MKRTAKILSVVLALALVIGAIAIVSSADTTGIKTVFNSTFDNLEPGYKVAAAEGVNPDGNLLGYVWTMYNDEKGARSGVVSVGLSEDGSEQPNQYIVIQNGPKGTHTDAPYFGTGYGGKNLAGRPSVSGGVLKLGDTDIANHPFLILDFDVMSPTANWSGSFSLEARSFLALKANEDENAPGLDVVKFNSISSMGLKFKTDANGTYIADAGELNKMYVNPYEFTHVTLIYESVATADSRSVNLHVYVNGEYFYDYAGGEAGGGNGVDGYYKQTPNLSYDEVRFLWDRTDDLSVTIGFDNLITRFFDNSYEGNLSELLRERDSIDEWADDLYDADNMPAGKAVCVVNGVKYANIEKAIEAAPNGATVKLLSDIAAPVTVSKLISFEPCGYNIDLRPGEGFAIDSTVEGILKLINSAGRTAEIYWDECLHDETCEDYDAMHPLYFVDDLAIGEKFYSAYNPEFAGYIGDDDYVYVLMGWKNATTGEVITADSVVTEDDVAEGFVMLEPIYEKAIKNFEYVENSATKTVYNYTMTLAEVIKAADKGSTVKLYSDLTIKTTTNTEYIDIGKKITLDLNGYTIKQITEGVKQKCSLFRLTAGTDLTVTSSRFGGKIFNEGWNSATGVGAAGMFNVPNDSAKLTIKGNIDGKPSLSLYTGCVIEGYSKTLDYHIDGGMFIAVVGDQQGLLDTRKAGADAIIENAFFYCPNGKGAIAFAGRDTATDDDCKVTVDNCVFIGAAVECVVKPVVLTMTNCYVTGDVNAVISSTYKTVTDGATKGQPNENGTVIIGEGNYFGGKLNGNIQYAEGVKLYEAPASLEVTYGTHSWKASANYTFDDSSFEVKDATQILNFTHYSSAEEPKIVNVIWKDAEGNVIATNKALAGSLTSAPADMKIGGTLVPGWLDYIPAEWNESLVVPEGVDEYVITAKEGGAVTPVVAVQIFFNIRLTTHIEHRAWFPAIQEGISIDKISFNNSDRLKRYNDTTHKTFATIGGEKYNMVDSWPGFSNVGGEIKFSLTFSYEGKSYTVAADTNIFEYFDYILDFVPAEGQADYSEDARRLVVNTANYVYKGLLALGNEEKAELFKAYADENPDRVNKLDKENLPEVDASKISKYVESIALHIDTYSPYVRFNLTDAGKAAKISLSTGAFQSSKNDYPTLGYIDTDRINMKSLNSLTITITSAATEGEESETVKFSFSLLEYYVLLAENGADAKTLDFVEAMWAYAKADNEY